jgi:MFS family permease
MLGATVLFGLTVGNLLMLHPLLLAERFGVRDYPRIYSRSQLAATLGIAAGPAAAGLLHDALDGYGAAFALIALASGLAGAVLATSGSTRPRVASSPA